MNDEKTIVEIISRAWKTYQETEKHGLDFGKTCYECQLKVATRGGVGNKGRGIVPTLEQLNIPKSTAYYWIKRYKVAAGLEAPPPEPEDSVLDGSEYANLTTISTILTCAEPDLSSDVSAISGPNTANMNIWQQIDGSPAPCSICGGAGSPHLCTNCGRLVCSQCWPVHRAGHPPNDPRHLRRLNGRTCSAPSPDELIRKVELALNIAISQWPRGESHQQLVEAVEAILDGVRSEQEETEAVMVGGVQ